MATSEAEALLAKETFFNKLQTLNESSDEDCVSDEVQRVLRKLKKPLALAPAPQRIRTPIILKKIPALQRAKSAPTSVSIVKETPPQPRQKSLLCEEITTPSLSFDGFVIKDTPLALPPSTTRLPGHRTLSTPSIGTDLVLNYSTGIETMLGKKPSKAAPAKKSKEDIVSLVPENVRIFTGLVFYYFPPNNDRADRKNSIKTARRFGATWVGKDWNPELVTHVIVEEKFTYEKVLQHLKLDSWPANIILVNKKYERHCIDALKLLDHRNVDYEVRNELVSGEVEPYVLSSQNSDRSLEIKSTNARPRNEQDPPSETPLPSQVSTQNSVDKRRSEHDETHESKLDDDYGGERSLIISTLDHRSSKRLRVSAKGDALDQMIAIAQGMKHLPLDDEDNEENDDEDTSRPASRDDETTSSDNPRPNSRNAPKSRKKKTSTTNSKPGEFDHTNFTCMTGGTGTVLDTNPNIRTIEILQELLDYYERTRDHWRIFSYKRAISTLKGQGKRICTFDEAFELPFIGARIALKIEEIVLTNRLRRLENAKLEPNDIILSSFMKIYGVGISQAWKWVLQGHKTLDDLVERVPLTPSQKMGIDKYDDLLTRIPRDEVTALGEIVRNAALEIDPDVQIIIGGSYRRGAAYSGDIDCLITKAGTRVSRDLLPFVNELVSKLRSAGFLVAALATPSERGSASKWHGCCVLPGKENPIWRRIDFLMVPATELGAALIYFTGDDIFNRSMRLLASKKERRLNQRGLYEDVMRGPGRVRLTEGKLLEGANEERIFEILGVPWRPPHERICY